MYRDVQIFAGRIAQSRWLLDLLRDGTGGAIQSIAQLAFVPARW